MSDSDPQHTEIAIVNEMLLREEYITPRISFRTLRVINRYRYTDYDTLTLDNYRLSPGSASSPVRAFPSVR